MVEPRPRVQIEVATDSVGDAKYALDHGASRVEFCSALDADGLTPDVRLLRGLLWAAPGRVAVMVRERTENFAARGTLLNAMERRIRQVVGHGAAGVVFGVLDVYKDHWRVDEAACGRLIRACDGVPATFHRAFDVCEDWEKAIDTLVALGFRRVLMSGGANLRARGALDRVAACVQRAAGRIDVIAGGGLRHDNARMVIDRAGCDWVHSSCRTGGTRLDTEALKLLVEACG